MIWTRLLFFLLIALFLLLSGEPARAFDSLFAKQRRSAVEQLLTPETKTPEEKDERQEAAEAVRRFHRNCLEQAHPALLPPALEKLCTCTAANIESRFPPERVLQMFGRDPLGQKRRDTAMEQAFAPCMKFAVQENAEAACLGDKVLKWKVRDHAKVCACLGQGVRHDFEPYESHYTDNYLKIHRGKYRDPLDWYFQSRDYQNHSAARFRTCAEWYGK